MPARGLRPLKRVAPVDHDTYGRTMIQRETVLFIMGLVIATLLTLVGTYYAVNWISPPITTTMPGKK
jgi:hypothetical protein